MRHPGTLAPYILVLLELDGPFEKPVLIRALDLLASRHQVLRARFFVGEDDRIRMRIAQGGPAELDTATIAVGPGLYRSWKARRAIIQFIRRPFDLTKGPVFRALLLERGKAKHDLAIVLHHIVCDAWSIGIVMREVQELYERCLLDPKSNPPIPKVQVADLARWEDEWLRTEAARRHGDYWRQRLANAAMPFWIPPERIYLPVRKSSVRHLSGVLNKEILEGLLSFCRPLKATPWMAVAASVAIVLRAWTDSEDVILRCFHSGRTRVDMVDLIGCFNSSWDLRIQVRSDATMERAITQVREAYVEALPHLNAAARDRAGVLIPVTTDNRGEPILFDYVPNVHGLYNESRSPLPGPGSDPNRVCMRPSSLSVARARTYRDPQLKLRMTFRETDVGIYWGMRCSMQLFSQQTIRWFSRNVMSVITQAASGRCLTPDVSRR